MGIVSPIGVGINAFWNSLLNGAYGIKPLSSPFLTNKFQYTQGGEINDELFMHPLKKIDKAASYMLAAAQEAFLHAKLTPSPFFPQEDIGIVLGTNFGNQTALESLMETDKGSPSTNKAIKQNISFEGCTNLIAKELGCGGPKSTLSLSCSSGAAVIAYAAFLIRMGIAPCFIAGGYDIISKFSWAGLSALKTMTTDKLRPFDKQRNGTIFSEGAAAVIIEELEHAIRRGASILAEVLGCSMNNNAFHMTAPDKNGEGMANAMQMALNDANLPPEKIEHINSHGTGTKHNDLAETLAIKQVFGKHAYNIPINSIKSMTGHMMGAAGTVEAIATILSIINGWIPPTINYEQKDPECDLDYVPNKARQQRIKVAISNSAGIGGNNSSIILGVYE